MRKPAFRRSANGRPRGSTDMTASARASSGSWCEYRAQCVGPVIAGMRISAGVSAEELAGRIRVDVRTVRSYESGRVIPPLFRLVAIAGALSCRVADLVVECDP